MSNSYFQFKKFIIQQHHCAMKVSTDACLFGAWAANEISESQIFATAKMLDLGAGTGLLSMMIAQKNDLEIDAIEIQKSCFLQAKENIEQKEFSSKIKIYNANAVEFEYHHTYDFIISNPPFYTSQLNAKLESKNLAWHNNQFSYEEVLQLIVKHLKMDGTFFLLLPYYSLQKITSQIQYNGLFIEDLLLVKHSEQHPVFRVFIKGNKANQKTETKNTIAIKTNENEYSKEFMTLLKDYYLNL